MWKSFLSWFNNFIDPVCPESNLRSSECLGCHLDRQWIGSEPSDHAQSKWVEYH